MCKEESLWKLLGNKTVSMDASLFPVFLNVYIVDSMDIVISMHRLRQSKRASQPSGRAEHSKRKRTFQCSDDHSSGGRDTVISFIQPPQPEMEAVVSIQRLLTQRR